MARPTKRTKETEATIFGALRRGLTVNAACGAAGISRESLSNWCQADAEFAADIADAKLVGQFKLENELHRTKSMVRAKILMRLLVCRDPDHQETKRIEMRGSLTIADLAQEASAHGDE